MVLYGICLNRLKTALRKVDFTLREKKDPPMVTLEAYFLTEDEEIRKHFSVRRPKKTIQEDINDISAALSRHARRRLQLEFIDDRGGLCLCYYPEKKE